MRGLKIDLGINKVYIKSKKEKLELDINDKLSLYKIFKNKILYINILEEEVYNDILTIPKTKKSNIDGIVFNHIKSKFINFQDVVFNYAVLDKINEEYRILYYCIYSKTLSSLKEFKEQIYIREVRVLHELILKELRRKVRKDAYYIIYCYRDIYYIYYIYNGILLSACNTRDSKEIPDHIGFIKNYINKTYGLKAVEDRNNIFYGEINGKMKLTRLVSLEEREDLWQYI